VEPLEEIFRANILRLVGKAKLKEVSAGSGVPYRSIQNATKGTVPQAKNLQKLADYWEVGPDSLLRAPGSLPPNVEALSEVVMERNVRIKALERDLHRAKMKLKENAKTSRIPRDILDALESSDEAQMARARAALFGLGFPVSAKLADEDEDAGQGAV
jgi:hypothetical protein